VEIEATNTAHSTRELGSLRTMLYGYVLNPPLPASSGEDWVATQGVTLRCKTTRASSYKPAMRCHSHQILEHSKTIDLFRVLLANLRGLPGSLVMSESASEGSTLRPGLHFTSGSTSTRYGRHETSRMPLLICKCLVFIRSSGRVHFFLWQAHSMQMSCRDQSCFFPTCGVS
jgi:hypothetical protein